MQHMMRLGKLVALAGGLALLVTACGSQLDHQVRTNDALKEARLDSVAPNWDPAQKILRLSGTVVTDQEKQQAEQVAASVIGNSGKVVNEIIVTMRGAPEPAPAIAQAGDIEKIDERIHADVEALFSDETVWKGREFEILVHSGTVRLTGQVLSQDEKDRVTEMVARVAGVKEVINRLSVKVPKG
ncbi:MAG: BON domain-containing protein [Vicinamibacterales bacterium]